MKKLIVAALMMAGMTSFAQEAKPMKTVEQRDQMTTEQRSQLHLKKLAFELNLDENQQQEMYRIITERAAKRETMKKEMAASKEKGVKPTADERYNRQNEMLDFDIAEKAKIKKLLNADQFAKWEKMKADRDEKMKDAKNKGERKAKPENQQK